LGDAELLGISRPEEFGELAIDYSHEIASVEELDHIQAYGIFSAMGLLQDAVADTIEYSRECGAFGKSILNNQFVHWRLAEMQTELEALRALFNAAVQAYIDGEDGTKLAFMAKYKMRRLAEWIPSECLYFWGGLGFMAENRISRT